MALHKRHHEHVFRGEEAREMLLIHRRDSHGDQIKNVVPEGFELQQKAAVTTTAEAVQTAVAVVYVTLPQTFSGAAVYSTLSNNPATTTSPAPVAAAQVTDSSSSQDDDSSTSNNGFGFPAASSTSSAAIFAAAATTGASSSAVLVGGASSTGTQGPSVIAGAPLQFTRSASSAASVSTPATTSSIATGTLLNQNSGNTAIASATPTAVPSDGGMSGGAKAGLAFGIILALALVGGLLFFCWRRRKNPDGHEELVDEKHTSFVDAKAKSMESRSRNSVMSEKVPASVRSVRTTSTAPRLSLRPVTQFLPNLSGEPNRNNGALDVGNGALAVSGQQKSAWERKPSQGANPFDDASASEKPRSASPQSNPFEEQHEVRSQDARGPPSGQSSAKHTPKTSWSGSEPATPKSTTFATAAAVPIPANGAPSSVSPPRGPNNVHRVQLDFKPSMDDELELRSGQLVRMLHEYDDGWALCIRMDRSQQGVAPRTCLSKLPVKPRPQGPPPPGGANGPNSRPGTAQSNRRPSNPQPPPSVAGAMYPRPLTPTQANRDRAQSVTHGEPAAPTSPNSGLPARKPVPGMAM